MWTSELRSFLLPRYTGNTGNTGITGKRSREEEEETPEGTFFDDVITIGKNVYIGIRDEASFSRWKDAYNYAHELETSNPTKTFLFSAQPKDCIVLAALLTLRAKSDHTIWRTADAVKSTTITEGGDFEHMNNGERMSASLSLLDWSMNESANSFLNGSISNASVSEACSAQIKKFPDDVRKIINKYYADLEPRYLCAFQFDDSQLNRYVRLSRPWGEIVPHNAGMKQTIQTIKRMYSKKEINYQYVQDIQCRILTTTTKSESPYTSYILKPSKPLLLDSDHYVRMEEELKEYYNRSTTNCT